MSNDSSPDLSGWQLAKHVAGGLPIGLLLGFLAGSLAYVVFMSPLARTEAAFLQSDSLVLLYHATGVMLAVYVGLLVTGGWIWHAEDVDTGIRLSEAFEEDTDAE
ncbi:hypothetical protein [Natrinema sp. DC36]|uniref:hypothetical protein n=1 Tax=Natrinema sp. DC36 TaxID=2878680 RepID=UPI001CF0C440|nr:hypothetical protein [Natrinema sp. DC36]